MSIMTPAGWGIRGRILLYIHECMAQVHIEHAQFLLSIFLAGVFFQSKISFCFFNLCPIPTHPPAHKLVIAKGSIFCHGTLWIFSSK